MKNIYELLDIIDEQTSQSELAVMEAMILSFDKASTIMESYDGDDIGCFGMIMESANDESAVKKILLFIPRLIASLFKSLRDAMSKKNKAVNITAPKPLPVKKDSDLGKKLAMAGAGAAVVCTGASVAIMGPKNAKETFIDSTVNEIKDRKHKKESARDLRRVIDDYNRRKKDLSEFRIQRIKDTKIFINDKGEWLIKSIYLENELENLKDYVDTFCILCNNENRRPVEKKEHHKKYNYEHYVANRAGSVIECSDLAKAPFYLCCHGGYSDKLDSWIAKANKLLDYVTSKELEARITNSITKLITDLENAGKTAKVIDKTSDGDNKEVGTKDLTTSYSKNKLAKYTTELPKFVLQIIKDYAEILSDILTEVNKQVKILEEAINKNNNSSVNESKTSDTESK